MTKTDEEWAREIMKPSAYPTPKWLIATIAAIRKEERERCKLKFRTAILNMTWRAKPIDPREWCDVLLKRVNCALGDE
jgi:hypothetical protein